MGTIQEQGINKADESNNAEDEAKDILTKMLDFLKKTPGSGLIIAAMSGLSFAIASFIIKMVPSVNSVQIFVTRSVIQLIFYAPFVFINKLPPFGVPGERLTLILNGFTAFIAFGLMYISYRLIPLADASTIVFSSPVWTSIFGYFLLHEPCGVIQTITIIIALIGVLLISKPSFIFDSFNENINPVNNSLLNNTLFNSTSSVNNLAPKFTSEERLYGSLIALISSILASVVFILLRKLKNTPSPVIVSNISVIAIFSGIIYEVIINNYFHYSTLASGISVPKELNEYLWLLGNGMCGVFGQLCLTVSLKLEEASLVSLVRTIDIVLAFILQALFLKDEIIDWMSIVGAFIVVIAVVTTLMRRIVINKSKLKRIISCGLRKGE